MGIQFFSYFCSQTKDDHCGHSLELPYLTCTHNLCFEHKQENQRTNGPVNAHLYGLGKHKTYKTWKIYCKEMTLTFNTHIPS